MRIGSGCDKSSDLDVALTRSGAETNQVHGDVLEEAEVMGGMSGTNAHLIVGEGYIHAPVKTVLDGPMLAVDVR